MISNIDDKQLKKIKRLNLFMYIAIFILAIIEIFLVYNYIIFEKKDSITIEAGQKITLKDFYKFGLVPKSAKFVTDLDKINTKKAGTYYIEIKEKKMKTL